MPHWRDYRIDKDSNLLKTYGKDGTSFPDDVKKVNNLRRQSYVAY